MAGYVPYSIRYFRYLWRFKLTPNGRFLLWGVLLTSAGLASVIIPIYQVFCILLSTYLLVWLINLAFRPKLDVSGVLPAKVTAGEEVRTEITLTNRSWRSAYDLMLWMVDVPRGIRFLSRDVTLPHLKPGESHHLPLVLQATRRGVFELPELRPHSTFPGNLMRSGSIQHPLGALTVVPKFHRLQEVRIPAGLRYQPGGVALSSHIGESPEYIGNREYIPGEPARRLDFRSWARLGRPVIREYQEEYYCRIALVLDTFMPGRRTPATGYPQLEAAISLSAAIADALSATEHLIDLFAAGPELYVFRAGRQLAHFDNVLEILASLDACRTDPFDTVAPAIAEELTSITTAVCVMLDWDASREKLARTIIDAGCQLKVILVRDEAPTMPLPADLADVTQLSVSQIESGGVESL